MPDPSTFTPQLRVTEQKMETNGEDSSYSESCSFPNLVQRTGPAESSNKRRPVRRLPMRIPMSMRMSSCPAPQRTPSSFDQHCSSTENTADDSLPLMAMPDSDTFPFGHNASGNIDQEDASHTQPQTKVPPSHSSYRSHNWLLESGRKNRQAMRKQEEEMALKAEHHQTPAKTVPHPMLSTPHNKPTVFAKENSASVYKVVPSPIFSLSHKPVLSVRQVNTPRRDADLSHFSLNKTKTVCNTGSVQYTSSVHKTTFGHFTPSHAAARGMHHGTALQDVDPRGSTPANNKQRRPAGRGPDEDKENEVNSRLGADLEPLDLKVKVKANKHSVIREMDELEEESEVKNSNRITRIEDKKLTSPLVPCVPTSHVPTVLSHEPVHLYPGQALANTQAGLLSQPSKPLAQPRNVPFVSHVSTPYMPPPFMPAPNMPSSHIPTPYMPAPLTSAQHLPAPITSASHMPSSHTSAQHIPAPLMREPHMPAPQTPALHPYPSLPPPSLPPPSLPPPSLPPPTVVSPPVPVTSAQAPRVSCPSSAAKQAAPNQDMQFTAPAARPVNTVLRVNGQSYVVFGQLGKGGSSIVYEVKDKAAKTRAIKVVKLNNLDPDTAQGYLNEITFLRKLQACENVIQLIDYEYVKKTQVLFVVMEKGETDLAHLLKDITKTRRISPLAIAYYWSEMVNAVKTIHDNGIIHSDLKPANFLLVSGRLKLIDFGIASALNKDMTSVQKSNIVGTFNYMSPEAVGDCTGSNKPGHKVSFKSDVWSLGCILYNLVYGRPPFANIVVATVKLVAINDPHHVIPYPPIPDYPLPPTLLVTMQRCLSYNPSLRPTAAELLRPPLLPTLEDPALVEKQRETIDELRGAVEELRRRLEQ